MLSLSLSYDIIKDRDHRKGFLDSFKSPDSPDLKGAHK